MLTFVSQDGTTYNVDPVKDVYRIHFKHTDYLINESRDQKKHGDLNLEAYSTDSRGCEVQLIIGDRIHTLYSTIHDFMFHDALSYTLHSLYSSTGCVDYRNIDSLETYLPADVIDSFKKSLENLGVLSDNLRSLEEFLSEVRKRENNP